jgi:hypothetical protein
MPVTDKYPEELRVPITSKMMQHLKDRAGSNDSSVAETVRRILAHQLSEEAAVDGIGAVEAAVRRVIQKELAPTRESVFHAAFNAKVVVSMIWALWRAGTLPLSEENANKKLGHYRQKAAEDLRSKSHKTDNQ